MQHVIIGVGRTGGKLILELRKHLEKEMQKGVLIQQWSVVSLDKPKVQRDLAPPPVIYCTYSEGSILGTLPDVCDVAGTITREKVAEILQNPDRLYRMSPHAFESFVGEVYRGLGYTVSPTKRSHDGGVDLYLTKHIDGMPHSYVVQCKHSVKKKHRIGVAYARELLGVAVDRAVTAAILVSNVLFSADTLRFAARHTARLFCVDQNGLLALMSRYLLATA